MSRRAGYAVVDLFEEALAEYCGAPFAVAVDSCTNAIFLSLKWLHRYPDSEHGTITVPQHTYVGVVQAAHAAGWRVVFREEKWESGYQLKPLQLWDYAKFLERGMYGGVHGEFLCLSFHWSKRLPIGRGGAILLDDPEARDWLRSARIDGRWEGEDYQNPVFQRQGWHCNLHGDDAARGLHLLTYLDDDDPCDWTAYPDLSVAEWT